MDQRVAINGFGRIGRGVLRQLLEDYDDIEVVATNDVAPLGMEGRRDTLSWGDRKIRYLQRHDPTELPWQELEVSLVIEASGKSSYRGHLKAGAKHVLVAAPTPDADLTVCVGVNDDRYDAKRHAVVSTASRTANCLVPVAKVLDDAFGIRTGFVTSIHAGSRRSIEPTHSGAVRATTAVLPQLAGRIDGVAMHVPEVQGAILDFVVQTEQRVTVDAVHRAFEEAAASERLRGILGVSDEELVSADITGSTFSALVDTTSTMVLGGHTVKVLAWYDNDGFVRRVADMARRMVTHQ